MSSVVEEILAITFTRTNLLHEALTHPSVPRRQQTQPTEHYQRLEFLGDSILGAVVSHLLYQAYPNEPEGQLAQRKSSLVAGATLVKVMDKLQLAEHIVMSDSEVESGGQQNKSVKEDVCEALIGAIYLDQGFSAAFHFVETHWKEELHSVDTVKKDAKTALQERVQAMGYPLPTYRLAAREGLAHEPIFTIAVEVREQQPVEAKARNKREAEQLAAAAMLQQLGAE